VTRKRWLSIGFAGSRSQAGMKLLSELSGYSFGSDGPQMLATF
jgi:hypothetical protein